MVAMAATSETDTEAGTGSGVGSPCRLANEPRRDRPGDAGVPNEMVARCRKEQEVVCETN